MKFKQGEEVTNTLKQKLIILEVREKHETHPYLYLNIDTGKKWWTTEEYLLKKNPVLWEAKQKMFKDLDNMVKRISDTRKSIEEAKTNKDLAMALLDSPMMKHSSNIN